MSKFTLQGLRDDPKERLQLYELMLIEWEKPVKYAIKNRTDKGFCWQLLRRFNINTYDCYELPELFKNRLIYNSGYHFSYYGAIELGRSQRVTALKNAIIEVKKLINYEKTKN